MTAPPTLRSRRDWPAMVRGTALDALRYTKFVAFMKRALPLGAFVVIGSVVVFFFLQRQPERMQMAYARLHILNDLTMIKPRLTGTDSKGNPFVITADTAIHDKANTKRATLKNVQADLTLGKKGWYTATAPHGVMDSDAGLLTLGGGIVVYSDSGYELHTATARADLDKGVMTGPTITGHGPMGTLRADRFHMDQTSHQILLEGNVQMTVLPAQKDTP